MEYEYGDCIVIRPRWKKYFVVRFRIDPVPYSGSSGYGKRNFYAWYKKPRTTQERRWSLADKKYVRGKRNMRNLTNAWDDYMRSDVRERRSWKNKKIEKQWQKRV